MKKSYVIKNCETSVAKLGECFTMYMPKEETYSKLSTLKVIKEEYLYITNYESNLVNSFEKMFSENKDEEFIIDSESYSNEELEKIILAFNKSKYYFSKGSKLTKNNSTISLTKDISNSKKSEVIASAINKCKDFINEPSNVASTTGFTNMLEDLAKESNLEFSIIDYETLKKDKAGGILAVNQGSEEKARIVKLELNNGSNKPICLVGKGLVFDTGGYSLKPSSSIVNMKGDMGGGALVSSVISALGKLEAKLNVVAFIPITDNLISAKAYRPDDVITFLNGKTAEIISTDAEGRLILADALTYATWLDPSLIIDAATLTGAIEVALGSDTTGVFGNNKSEIDELVSTVNSLEEYAWHMPINNSHRKLIEGKIATVKNSARPGGACGAAAFLEHFVEDKNWIHLDIAGSAWSDKTGATGSMVRPLIEYLLNKE